MSTGKTVRSWRDVLKVHPAAALFPMMSEAELKGLGEDIKANGLQQKITLIALQREGERTEYSVVDGRNRLDAMEAAGIEILSKNWLKLGKFFEVISNRTDLVAY